jgi:hypothetical protein
MTGRMALGRAARGWQIVALLLVAGTSAVSCGRDLIEPPSPAMSQTTTSPAVPGSRDQSLIEALARCRAGESLCRGQCVNLLASDQNCGVCARYCPKGKTCRSGRCVGASVVAATP